MNELHIWEFIQRQLQNGNKVGLMTVVQSEGSSPGRQGFKMAVAQDGSMAGSIGGGIMEHKLVEYVRDKLTNQEFFWELRKQVHSKDAPRDQSGMICSGTQWIALLELGENMTGSVGEIVASLKSGNRIQLNVNELGLNAAPLAPGDSVAQSDVSTSENWSYSEVLGYRDTVHVIGGGHVGLEMCKVMSMLNFHVVNYDDRPGLNTMEANDFADEKVVSSYDQLGALIEGGESDYVIVMTFGYRGDDAAIRSLLGKEFAYLGMMGSETKVAKLLHDLEKDNFPANQIASIRTPAGLTTHCKTPIEIAVSIAAEIIAVKNNRV